MNIQSKFSAIDMSDLAHIVGTKDAAERIRKECNEYLASWQNLEQPSLPGTSGASLKRAAKKFHKAAIAMEAAVDAVHFDSLDLALCAFGSRESNASNFPAFIEQLRIFRADAKQLTDRIEPRPGPKVPPGISVFVKGMRLVLLKEGLKHSTAEGSKMEKALSIIFRAAGIKRNARELLITIFGSTKAKPPHRGK